jgi:hypothetical protein
LKHEIQLNNWPLDANLSVLCRPLILHILPVSVQHSNVNEFNGIVNLKPLCPGQ